MGKLCYNKEQEETRYRVKEVLINEKHVSCGTAEDHPLVYYTVNEKGYAICGYCNTKYIYTDPIWWSGTNKKRKNK